MVGRSPKAQPSIKVTLHVDGQTVDEEVVYMNGETSNDRKRNHNGLVKQKKQNRGKGQDPTKDHSEDFHHPSWITRPGEIVAFVCEKYFTLEVDYDRNVTGIVPNAPSNPFDWDGPQSASLVPGVGYEVRGISVRDAAVQDQMFYKFTATIEGVSEPFDPDGMSGP
jgi:hypothetical protein